MADDREEQREETPENLPSAQVATGGGGFLSVYKAGQGYWVRMGTAIAAALLVILIAQFIYSSLKNYTELDYVLGPKGRTPGFPTWKLAITGVFVLICVVLGWKVMNKPTVVDFLIATESEMKKVNWTSRKDLIGSTKVVILFMFVISAALFIIDVVFMWFFWAIGVLENAPFS